MEVNSSVAAVEGGKVGESALGKLTSSAKAMQAMQKGQEKLGGNLFLDVQVDHFEVRFYVTYSKSDAIWTLRLYRWCFADTSSMVLSLMYNEIFLVSTGDHGNN